MAFFPVQGALEDESREAPAEEEMQTPREEEDEVASQQGHWDHRGWAWSYEWGWFRIAPPPEPPRSVRSAETTEWLRRDLPEIIPDYVQGWFLLMDAGLDTMERNVLHADLKGDFGVRAVEDALRKHWTEADLKRRDSEKGRQFGNLAAEAFEEDVAAWVEAWDEEAMAAEGQSSEEVSFLSSERDRAVEALAVLQQTRRTLRDARSRQHAVKMSRQFYPLPPRTSGSRNDMWKALKKPDVTLKCFRCGGPHKVAECKEPPNQARPSANVTEEAPLVFLAETLQEAMHASEEAQGYLTTKEVMEQGKAIVDGGATRTIGSVAALARVVDLNCQRRGESGIKGVDLDNRPVFGFGNSSRDQCASTTDLEIPLNGRLGTLTAHALDKGSAPVLMSIQSLRKLGAIIDFASNMAVFRSVDPRKLVELECTASGHQVIPLTEDAYRSSKVLKEAMPAFSQLE